VELITERQPPANRIGRHIGDSERHMSEAAVMLAVAKWLFGLGATEVAIHPDGMHMKGFDIPGWLTSAGFERTSTTGVRAVSGAFKRGNHRLTVHSRPGLGDVIAQLDGIHVEVEAKGGCINSRHPGQLSRLRKGLHEAIGQLMGSPRQDTRLIAAVPYHPETEKLAKRLAERCKLAYIEIALIRDDGTVMLL
jgi:hypothetical protein